MEVTGVIAAVTKARRTGSRLDLDLSLLTGPAEIEAENLSAAVPAGYPLTQLSRELAQYGLFYPPARDLAGAGTVGAHLSAATCGPWRLGRGSTRDWVLGLEAVTGRGTPVRTGGKVVKNVAGLDVTKLMIGSRGRLGIIVRAHLRLAPLPAARAIVAAQFSSASAALKAVPDLLTGPLGPGALELDQGSLLVGFEGTPADIPKRAEAAQSILAGCGGLALPEAVFPIAPITGEGVMIRAGVPARHGLAWIASLPPNTPVQGHAGNGVFRAMVPNQTALLAALRTAATDLGGYCVAETESDTAAASESAADSAVKALTAQIQQIFDPDRIFARDGAEDDV